jgi:hypothetical protein
VLAALTARPLRTPQQGNVVEWFDASVVEPSVIITVPYDSPGHTGKPTSITRALKLVEQPLRRRVATDLRGLRPQNCFRLFREAALSIHRGILRDRLTWSRIEPQRSQKG